MKTRYLALISLMVGAVFILAACGQAEKPTSTSVPFSPSPATGEPTATPGGDATPTVSGTTAPTEPAGEGDAANGEALFTSNGCSGCHSTGSDARVGPGLAGVMDRAGTRVEGLSAEEYITQSIHDPHAYIVEGFGPIMPTTFADMPESDIRDLIAYFRTLE